MLGLDGRLTILKLMMSGERITRMHTIISVKIAEQVVAVQLEIRVLARTALISSCSSSSRFRANTDIGSVKISVQIRVGCDAVVCLNMRQSVRLIQLIAVDCLRRLIMRIFSMVMLGLLDRYLDEFTGNLRRILSVLMLV